MAKVLEIVVDIVWGLPLLILLLAGGLYLLWVSRFLPLKGFRRGLLLTLGRYHHKGDDQAEGQVSYFQALTNALSATVGLGNIAGVAVAISQGGPGAIFWMWIAAIIGMNTKFFESALAVMYRGRDYRGDVQGGAMYIIENTLDKKFRPLAYLFAGSGLIGTLAMFQTNQLASFNSVQYNISPWVTGIVCALFAGTVILGGLKRIAHVTSSLVPVMCVIYILSSLIILVMNLEKIPQVFMTIFQEAFNFQSATGGVAGYIIWHVIKTGVKRASFSNEAGMGSAPMAHSNAKTSRPVSEGLVAMFGPLLDTLIICTMTALVLLVSLESSDLVRSEMTGISMTLKAYQNNFGSWGGHLLGISILLFSLTTMVGMSNYNKKCYDYIFRGRSIFNNYLFMFYFSAALFMGAIVKIDVVVNLIDTGYALMSIPNMIVIIILAPRVKEDLERYFVENP